MSLSNAEKLLRQCKADEVMAKKFQKAGVAGFETFASDSGLPCSLDDFKQAIKSEAKSGQLSEEDLERVSGGWGYFCM